MMISMFCRVIKFELLLIALVFFFFQAEDGIRDTSVTGVQTCALPIWLPNAFGKPRAPPARGLPNAFGSPSFPVRLPRPTRSEERRVGKECSRRSGEEQWINSY